MEIPKMDGTTIVVYLIILAFAGIFIIAPIIGAIVGLIQLLKHPEISETRSWFYENLPKQWAEIKKALADFKRAAHH